MPFPQFHAARLRNPDKYDSFRYRKDGGGSGIDFVFGILNGVSELQAIRFDKTKYTEQEAREWLRKHDFKPISFEPAKKD